MGAGQPISSAIATKTAIAERKLSAREAVRHSIDAIEKRDATLHSFLQTFPDQADAHARAIDARIAKGEHVGAMAGIPVALKDNICLAQGRTTCGSRMLERYESPFSATAARRLIDAGAIIVGKTNLDEFAMGSSTENSAFGPTRNPHDPERVPGGSSGGSAAAVAAGMVPLALGSDTGGSVRQPAGMCGVVGFKPTYGRVSRYGLVAYASSLDQIGPIGHCVADIALGMNVIGGLDPLDSTSAHVPIVDYLSELQTPVDGLRIGVPPEARSGSNHPGVNAAVERAIAVLRTAGAAIIDIELPHLKYGIAAYYIVAPAEASSNLARFDGVRYGHRATLERGDDLYALYAKSRAEGFGAEVQRRIMLGTYVLSSGYYDAFYLTALKARRLIKQDFDRAFSTENGNPGIHAVLMPSSPHPAWKLGEKGNDPLSLYLEDVYTVTANLAGICGLTLPCGTADEGGKKLPVGVQLLGAAFDDVRLLRVGRMLENVLNPHSSVG